MPLWGSAIYSPLSGHWLSECCRVLLLCTQGTYHYVVERFARSLSSLLPRPLPGPGLVLSPQGAGGVGVGLGGGGGAFAFFCLVSAEKRGPGPRGRANGVHAPTASLCSQSPHPSALAVSMPVGADQTRPTSPPCPAPPLSACLRRSLEHQTH
jgi:hypothetical protein